MRFMILRKADSDTEAGMMAGEELINDMAGYVQEMVDAGVMLSGDGLKPSSRGARVKFSGGKPTVIDGPFTESKELIAGVSVIDVASREEAIEWVKRWPASDGNGQVEIEIREMYEVEELGSGEGIDQHISIREQLAKK